MEVLGEWWTRRSTARRMGEGNGSRGGRGTRGAGNMVNNGGARGGETTIKWASGGGGLRGWVSGAMRHWRSGEGKTGGEV
ncbi:hypothetical protein Nepgr_006732 [Nepenthes gracilis]|uniref:Uncharacterized protein n=1 Tax=Nepenthes gracilis TaxID=150966 RepID=A0AAD3S6E3_NEPGR|nr:hypothetical protein Nepgr_006732 [Nepenthes gracilis]